MKKSELTQLTQVIEHLVAREVRKQLPKLISETLQNMGQKPIVTEQRPSPQVIDEEIESSGQPVHEVSDFKASLRELFAGTSVMSPASVPNAPRVPKTFAKDPVLNQILNETISDLGVRERMVGAAAFQGGYSPSLAMVPGFNASTVGPGQMMAESESPMFSRNMPSIPIGTPPVLAEGQESTHAPLEALPQGVSVHDMKQHAPPAVQGALTRNYSQMMKLIDKKKGKI